MNVHVAERCLRDGRPGARFLKDACVFSRIGKASKSSDRDKEVRKRS